MVRKASILTVLLAAALSLLLSGCANEAGKSYEEGLRLFGEGQYQEAIKAYQLSVSQGYEDPVIYADNICLIPSPVFRLF